MVTHYVKNEKRKLGRDCDGTRGTVKKDKEQLITCEGYEMNFLVWLVSH